LSEKSFWDDCPTLHSCDFFESPASSKQVGRNKRSAVPEHADISDHLLPELRCACSGLQKITTSPRLGQPDLETCHFIQLAMTD
jgi:hypothetical protein